MFGFYCDKIQQLNGIESKLHNLIGTMSQKWPNCNITTGSSNNFFEHAYNIGIFNLPDSDELEVKKIIEDFIYKNELEFKFE